MTPFFFGTKDRRLFGVYQPSRREAGRSGVVLCYPSGQEYVPAHKAFKFLASLLAEAGHDVLRFDYHGTGDSGGDLDDGTRQADSKRRASSGSRIVNASCRFQRPCPGLWKLSASMAY